MSGINVLINYSKYELRGVYVTSKCIRSRRIRLLIAYSIRSGYSKNVMVFIYLREICD